MDFTFRPIQSWPGKATSHSSRRRSPFNATLSATWRLLETELRHLGAKNIVIEADCDSRQIRNDGKLRADAKLNGPGIILSFESKRGALRFPSDRFLHWDCNLRAIALSLEALRKVDRYGVTQKAEQYTGWAALPDRRTEEKNYRQVAAEWMVQQCYAENVYSPMVGQIMLDEAIRREVYKQLAVKLHPDRKGSDELFKKLQDAMALFSLTAH